MSSNTHISPTGKATEISEEPYICDSCGYEDYHGDTCPHCDMGKNKFYCGSCQEEHLSDVPKDQWDCPTCQIFEDAGIENCGESEYISSYSVRDILPENIRYLKNSRDDVKSRLRDMTVWRLSEEFKYPPF